MKINIKLNQFYISSGWVRWGGIKQYQNYLKPVTSFKKKSQIRSKFAYLNFKPISLEMKQLKKLASLSSLVLILLFVTSFNKPYLTYIFNRPNCMFNSQRFDILKSCYNYFG